MRRAGRRAVELLAGDPQGEGEVGGAVAAEAEEVLDDQLRRSARALGGEHHGLVAEGHHAGVERGPPEAGGGGHGGGGQPGTAHRAAAVDEQAQGEVGARPLAGVELAEVGGHAVGPGGGQGLEAAVEVELAGGAVGGGVAQAADAPAAGGAGAHDVDHHPPGEVTGQVAEAGVGGAGEVGEQGEGLVGVVAQGVVEGGLVELPDLGGDVLEARRGGRATGGRWCAGRPRPPPPRPRSPSRVRSSSLRRSSARTPPGRGVRLFPSRRSPGSRRSGRPSRDRSPTHRRRRRRRSRPGGRPTARG